jgi:hypothetical protein
MPVSYDLIPRVKFEIVALDPQVEDIVSRYHRDYQDR